MQAFAIYSGACVLVTDHEAKFSRIIFLVATT